MRWDKIFPFFHSKLFYKEKMISFIKFIVFVGTFVIPFYYGFGTVINYGYGSNFLTSFDTGSGSTRQKVTVPVPQHCWQELWIQQHVDMTLGQLRSKTQLEWKFPGIRQLSRGVSTSATRLMSPVGISCLQPMHRTNSVSTYSALRD